MSEGKQIYLDPDVPVVVTDCYWIGEVSWEVFAEWLGITVEPAPQGDVKEQE